MEIALSAASSAAKLTQAAIAGLYIRDPHAPVAHANVILVLPLAGSQISVVTGFLGGGLLPVFRLPRILPD